MAGDADLAARMADVVRRGRAEFPDFDTASGYVVGMSADQPALRDAIAELGDDAHRVVARLADDPDEAARILALRGPKLGAALGRFASAPAPVAPKSPPAPKPEPTPILHDPAASMKDWSAAWDKRHEGRKPYEPKSRDIYDPNISSADFNHELDRRAQEKHDAVRAEDDAYVKLMRRRP